MVSLKWWKKAVQIYVLSLVLVVTQISMGRPAYAQSTTEIQNTDALSTPSVTSAFVPPGFTAEDFKVVEEMNTLAEENRRREADRNNGKVDVEHDISSSECRTQAANKNQRMNDITRYRSLTGAQGYDEICRLRQKLNQQTGGPEVRCNGLSDMTGNSAEIDRTGQLQSLDDRYGTSPGDQVAHVDDQAWDERQKAAKERLDKAKIDLERKRKLVPEKRAAYEQMRNRCEARNYGCLSRAEREELARLKKEYEESVVGLAAAEKEHKKAKRDYEYMGKPLMSEKSNMDAAGSETLQNDKDMVASDNFSGISQDPNGPLTGPVYETNEQLKGAIDRYTANAEQFAKEKIEHVRDLEFRNQNRGEYELYEMSLADFDGTSGSRMALSNTDVMAMASASIKKLSCSKKEEHDSKAYHIFRAASATYVAAIIRDKGSNQDFNECIRDEIFNDAEKNDEQFETVERALNSHTQIVDTMCTMVNPDPDNIPEVEGQAILSREQVQHLKEVCDASAGVGCTNEGDTGCAPRTRETALEMYRTALMVAQQELADKRQLVATAEANVKKGKKKIKATKKKILVATALMILFGLISRYNFVKGAALNASICACGAPFIILGKIFLGISIFWAGMLAYYLMELKRWIAFTKKWQKKLEKARNHTHLACNYDKAKGAYAMHEKFAADTQEMAREAMRKKKEEIQGSFNESGLGAIGATSMLMLPKGITIDQKKALVEIFIKKYINVVGNSALDLVFPRAFANNQDVENNNVVATTTAMADSQRSAMAAGMAIGSTSFYHFIIRQNTHWQDQAFDADPYPNPSTVGYVHEQNPIMYCNQASSASGGTGGSGCIRDGAVGMPTPETRVRLLTNVVALVQENLSGMLEHLDKAVGQRDKYVMLLNQMRNAMKLGTKGTDTQVEEKPVMPAGSCMKKNPDGQYETDPQCACQKNGNCASLQYPDFGTFAPGVLADSEAAVKKFSDASLSGKLKKANVAAGEVQKNSNAVRRRIRDNFEELNKERKENGLKSINFVDAAKRDIAESRKSTMEKYTNLFKENFKAEKTRGGLSTYYNDLNLGGSKGDGESKVSPVLAAFGNTNAVTGSKASGAQKGVQGKDDEEAILFDWDVDDIDSLSPEQISALQKQKDDAAALAALSKGQTEGNTERYSHDRSNFNSSASNNTGINKDRKKNLFGIISTRYKKTAFPIFLDNQFVR